MSMELQRIYKHATISRRILCVENHACSNQQYPKYSEQWQSKKMEKMEKFELVEWIIICLMYGMIVDFSGYISQYHYELKTHENLVKLFIVNSQIFHRIFMVKSMTFSWSQCHEKDLKNPMKNLWKFPYSRPMKYWVKWPRSHEIPMKMAFHGLFKGTEKPMNFKPKISWCQYGTLYYKVCLNWNFPPLIEIRD